MNIKYFALLFIMTFSSYSWSRSYICSLNYVPLGKSIDVSQADQYIKSFIFDSTQSKGRKVKFKGDEVMVWNKNKEIQVRFTDGKSKTFFHTQFSPIRPTFSVKLNGSRSFKCKDKSKPGANPTSSSDGGPGPLTQASLLENYKKDLDVLLSSNLTIKYFQENVQGRMRPIIFQGGKLYTADDERDNDGNWCILNFQLQLDENTEVDRGTRWDVISTGKFSNSSSHHVYTFTFVDIGRGKKMNDNNYYAPFSLECRIKKAVPFSYKLFRRITGERLAIKHGK